MTRILFVALLGCLFVHLASCDDDDSSPEPPFPLLFDPTRIAEEHRLHIVSETVSDSNGYETSEEYVDLKAGKSTTVVTGKTGHTVYHLEASTGLIYTYSPYKCKVSSATHDEILDSGSVWATVVEVIMDNGEKKIMQVVHLVALWLNAERLPKNYAKSNFIYSASKDIYRPAHKWTFTDKLNKQLVHMYFISNGNAANSYSLEMIQLESVDTNKIVQTTNILSIEYTIPEEVYDDLLQVPVGYGCMDESAKKKAEVKYGNINYNLCSVLSQPNHRIEIEATATKFENTANNGIRRLSDTISVEIVRSQEKAPNRHNLQLIRTRDTNQDKKIILDYIYKVQYAIDLRKATCEMGNLASEFKSDDEQVALKFSNGLALEMDHTKLAEVFSSYDYYLVKEIGSTNGGGRKFLYFERTSFSLFKGKTSRIIRTYSAGRDQGASTLESVTIWVFDLKMEHIIESYHLNLIDVSEPADDTEMAKLFDMSEECYLNNDKMKFGRDYTWFELFYPTDSRTNEILTGQTGKLKREITYSFAEKGGITFLQMPKLEIMFEETGFVVRALMLDVPSLHLVYDFHPNQTLYEVTGDAHELAVDVEHCADLCRFHHCTTMTFCPGGNICLLSIYSPGSVNNTLSDKNGCNTYTLPREGGFSHQDINAMRLHSILGKLRHNDYTPIALPKMPEELYLPQSETGINKDTYKKIEMDYKKEVHEVVMNEGHKLPMLTLTIYINNHPVFLLPSRFDLEQDPLSDFQLGDETLQDDQSMATAFHQGLNMYRYKMVAFDAELRRNARLFNGLTYDQCALACIDSKCSSFSYCSFRQECTITDIYDIGASMSKSIVEADSDCFIAQRDYVSKFNKFPDVYRPNAYLASVQAINPSECAHTCFIETGYNCLAFDYCELPADKNSGQIKPLATCYFFDQRQLFTPRAQKISNLEEKKASEATGCDHYTRSYLADFRRAEFREVEPTELAKLKTSEFPGANVDWCAYFCINNVVDCTAFQFCVSPDRPWAPTCTTIESRPQVSNSSDTRVTLDPQKDNAVVDAGRFFKTNDNCHVFIMRSDAMEASARDSAFSVVNSGDSDGKQDGGKSGGGLTVGGGILLYLGMTIVFASLSAGVCVAKYHNSYVAAKVERMQILLGL